MALGKESSSNVDAPMLKKKAKPRLRSEAGSVDRANRDDRPEKQTNMDRQGGPSRDSVRHSPPPPRPPVKRISPDREPSAEDAGSKAERNQKGSVFCRISFPPETGEGDRGTVKRKKTSSEPPNGLMDQHEQERDRPVANGCPSSSAGRGSGGGGGGVGYDYESSDEDRHFKRRSSARRVSE